MSSTDQYNDDVERGRGGGLAQPQHEEIGMNNRDDPSQSPEESHRQHQEFEDGANDLWSLYGKEAQIYDESWMKTMKDDMGGILIFAGIFSAVLTAFLVPKIQDLKVDSADQSAYYQNQTVHMLDRISQQLASIGDQISIDSNSPLPYPTFYPSVSDMRVNLSWLFSLICSLFAAFLATLVQLWSKNYMHIFQQANNPLRFARTRVSLFEGPKRLSELAEAVHGLMQISVMLFLWGLGDAIGQINRNIFLFVLPPIAMGSCLYIYWTWSSIRNPLSPYRTPLAMFISIFISLFICGPASEHRNHQEQSAMEETKISLNQDVRAIRWLIDRISGSDEMQALALAIPGSFNGKWGQEVWKGVVRDQSTSPANLQARSLPGFPSTRQGTTVYKLCRRMRHFFEAHKYEGNFVDAGSVHTRRMRAYVETAASLVCCADVKLDSFGDIAYVLSEVGDKEQTNNTLSIGLNPLFTVRWTCLSLVAIKQIINDNRLQELVKLALDGITSFQTNLGSRLGDTVTTALTVSQKMDHDLKKAWGAVLDLRLALESRSQSQNQTESGIRSILITSSCEASIQELERIATEAVGLKEVDWRIRFLQETMDEVTHKLTRRLPGAFFDELRPTAPIMTIEASDLPSVQTTPFPPQLIFPGQQLQSIYILGQRLRDITQRQNTEWDEETLKSLKYLREVPIPLCGFNYLMERQIWRLLDLRDGGGLGFTIELFFLALRQLSSASPSSESKKVFYAGTFDVITSNWEKSKNSAGTQRILLDLLCDLIIQGRGIFSDFRYPGYIVEMLLDLVGKTVEGLGQTGHPHIDNLYNELMDGSLMNRMDVVLRDKTLSTIRRALDTVSS